MTNPLERRGKRKGDPKTGGRKPGSINVQSTAVREAVLRVFENLNEADVYLREIAESDPRLFLSLVARLIPQASEVTLDQKVTVNIGDAMDAAQARLEQQYAPVIEAAPVEPAQQPEPEATEPETAEAKSTTYPGYEDE